MESQKIIDMLEQYKNSTGTDPCNILYDALKKHEKYFGTFGMKNLANFVYSDIDGRLKDMTNDHKNIFNGEDLNGE